MAQQWYRDKLALIGFAAGLAVLAGLALAYASKPAAPEESDDKGDPPPTRKRTRQKEEPDGKARVLASSAAPAPVGFGWHTCMVG